MFNALFIVSQKESIIQNATKGGSVPSNRTPMAGETNPPSLPLRRQARGNYLSPQRPTRHHPRHRRTRRSELFPPHLLRPAPQGQLRRRHTRHRSTFLTKQPRFHQQSTPADKAIALRTSESLFASHPSSFSSLRRSMFSVRCSMFNLPQSPTENQNT